LSTTNQLALEVNGLCAGYGRMPILTGVSFQLTTGRVIGVLGHNGMGKTTLLRTLIGHIAATAGTIRLDGHDITHEPVYTRSQRGIGYIPQGREIFPQLSVLDNLRMGAAGHRIVMETMVRESLDDFPVLKPLLGRQGGTLSGGEQQILAIARCLCSAPRIVLLDEPTEGIQPSIIDQITEILFRFKTGRGLTMVLVEQNLDFLAALCDEVLVLQKGLIARALDSTYLRNATIDDLIGYES
jgi:branched-chain amino acid transport system ATP-binding protein